MMLATFESGGNLALIGAAGPTTSELAPSSTSNSTICTCPSAKTSRLTRGGDADRRRDRVRRFELGRHDEVDVQLPLPP